MKAMTCEELGGACEIEFQAETFEEVMKLSMEHAKAMFQKADRPHLTAMQNMKELRESGDMEDWMDTKRDEFDSLPDCD